jgi:Na+-translocating ferredoxin:NAD+ oxidoreductase RnfG subunit
MTTARKAFLSIVVVLTVRPGSVWGRVFMTQEEALRLAFPSDVLVERKNLYLTEAQKKDVELKAQSKLDSLLISYYVGTSSSGPTGYAFFDTHIVRTMPEVLMTVVNPDGAVRFVEVLAFSEPEDYLPIKRWFGSFKLKKLEDGLWVKRSVRNVTGATLTTRAITSAVRRALAVFDEAVNQERNKIK